MDPKAGCESLYFNERCLKTCNCQFEIETMNPDVIRRRMDNITKNVNNMNRFFSNLNAENMKLVRPAFDKYMAKAGALHEEFGKLVREHTSKAFGCDEGCIEDCLDKDFVTFWEIPMCMRSCHCKEGVIAINRVGGASMVENEEGEELLIGSH